MIYEIPLTPEPQRFSISIGATTYNLRFCWNENDIGGWFMDIADDNENPILMGIPLVTGSNLLEQFAYLGIEGKFRRSRRNDYHRRNIYMIISENRTVYLQETSFFKTDQLVRNTIMPPTRSVSENLDYSVDISSLLNDEADSIVIVKAIVQKMNIDWLSFWESYILMKLEGGTPQSFGKIALNVTTSLKRRFNLSLTQKIKDDLFDPSPPQSCVAPNHVAFECDIRPTATEGKYVIWHNE